MVDNRELILTWSGEVDLANIDQLRDDIDHAVHPPCAQRLVLDLTRVAFIDSLGLGLLMHTRAACQKHEVELVLRGTPTNVLQLLDLTGMTALFRLDD